MRRGQRTLQRRRRKREVSRLIGQRRTGWCLPVSLYHFAAAGLRAAHGRYRALCRAGNRHVRDSQSGMRRELNIKDWAEENQEAYDIWHKSKINLDKLCDFS